MFLYDRRYVNEQTPGTLAITLPLPDIAVRAAGCLRRPTALSA